MGPSARRGRRQERRPRDGDRVDEGSLVMESMRQFSRRTFIAWVGGACAGFYLFGRLPGMSAPIALAQIPGGTLDPNDATKFVPPMLITPVMPRAGTITQRGGKNVDYYE